MHGVTLRDHPRNEEELNVNDVANPVVKLKLNWADRMISKELPTNGFKLNRRKSNGTN